MNCIKCPHYCKICYNSSNGLACNACDVTQFRFNFLNENCPCLDGYYDDG